MDRRAEAEKFVKEGRKAAKGGFFKKPDWDAAAVNYDQAANLYFVLKQLDNAKECYMDAWDAHYKANNYYFAAKALEALARICQDQKDPEKASSWLEKAAMVYAEDGKSDKQADCFTRAARLVMDENPQVASELLEKSVTVYVEESKWHLSSDAFRLLASTYIKEKKWAEATATIERKFQGFRELNQPHNVHKAFAEIIIIHLASKDSVAAEKMYSKACQESEFGTSDDGVACSALLSSYNSGDPEELEKCTKNQMFTFLTTEVAKLVRTIMLSASSAPSTTPVMDIVQQGSLDPLAPTANTDELNEDNLC